MIPSSRLRLISAHINQRHQLPADTTLDEWRLLYSLCDGSEAKEMLGRLAKRMMTPPLQPAKDQR